MSIEELDESKVNKIYVILLKYIGIMLVIFAIYLAYITITQYAIAIKLINQGEEAVFEKNHIIVDPKTKIEYIRIDGSITPRLDKDGNISKRE